jgi:hypothetical protein
LTRELARRFGERGVMVIMLAVLKYVGVLSSARIDGQEKG